LLVGGRRGVGLAVGPLPLAPAAPPAAAAPGRLRLAGGGLFHGLGPRLHVEVGLLLPRGLGPQPVVRWGLGRGGRLGPPPSRAGRGGRPPRPRGRRRSAAGMSGAGSTSRAAAGVRDRAGSSRSGRGGRAGGAVRDRWVRLGGRSASAGSTGRSRRPRGSSGGAG